MFLITLTIFSHFIKFYRTEKDFIQISSSAWGHAVALLFGRAEVTTSIFLRDNS